MDEVEVIGEAAGSPALSPPPSSTPSEADVQLEQKDLPKYSIISRCGSGNSGKLIPLLTNHFKVSVEVPDVVFYQYNVSITSEGIGVIEGKRIGRKLIDRLYQTYSSELSNNRFAYDGEKTLYTVSPLPQDKSEFTVVLEESFAKCENGSTDVNGSQSATAKRSKRVFQSKIFKLEISYAAKIPLNSTTFALKGNETDDHSQDALRVLDTILRQEAANRECLLVRQSFFHDDSRNFTDIGGGAIGVRGFHSSFCQTQGGLSLNMDVATTIILKPGPVLDFLKANQNAKEIRDIDWVKARKMLKNMRVKTKHTGLEFKIIGLSEKPCNQQNFSMKVGSSDGGNSEVQTVEITVYEYFLKHCNIELTYSVYMPCLIVGRPKRPYYLPLEVCSLVSLQRYTKALSTIQRAALVEKSRQKPQERIKMVTDAMEKYKFDEDPLLAACGINIEKELTQVNGRVLETPKLKVGSDEECIPRMGRWNFNNKTVKTPRNIGRWAVVNFSARCDTSYISRELISCARKKGMHIERPYSLIEEHAQSRTAGPVARVEKMFERLMDKLPDVPEFILCVLPEKKNSEIYGPWKKKCLSEIGFATQCICPLKINDQYLTNVLLKINSKLGGINSLLEIEHLSNIPLITDAPTMILGMDVSHGPPGQSNIPSIAAVVGSLSWPLISRYKASVRTQSPKSEIIDSLYKPLPNGDDDGIMRELLVEFFRTSRGVKPKRIIVFRDGLGESQFNQVLDKELEQMIKAYKHLGEDDIPKFTVIVGQKKHHTRLFRTDSNENVPPGTVVDTKIVHPNNYDFYMCAQAGMLGTSRPVHYHVLLDEIGFSPDELQNLVLSLSYVYQRSTAAVSMVAPVCYAHLAAAQMAQFLKFEDLPETNSEQNGITSPGAIPVPELPRLHENVQGSMFFC